MKKNVIILTLFGLVATASHAQQILPKSTQSLLNNSRNTLFKQKSYTSAPVKPAKQTRTIERRLIAESGETAFEGNFSIDSSTYVHAGTRGSSLVSGAESLYNFLTPLFFELTVNTNADDLVQQGDFGNVQAALMLKNQLKTTKTFNALNQTIEEIINTWNGTVWTPNYKNNYTYNANGFVAVSENSFYNGSTWELISKTTFTYNAQHAITSQISENYNNGTWEPSMSHYYAYDASNRIVLDSLLSNFNTLTSSYENRDVEAVQYGSNTLTSTTKSWIPWLASYREDVKVDAILSGNKLTSALVYEYDTLANEFPQSPIEIDSVFYNQNNQPTLFKMEDLVEGFINEMKTTYNAQNLPTIVEFNDEGVLIKDDYEYDSFNKVTKNTTSYYDEANTIWIEIGTKKYYYESYENGIPQGSNDFSSFDDMILYPNPSSANTTISFTTNHATKAKISVTDFLGRTLFSMVDDVKSGTSLLDIPTASLSSGSYLINLTLNGQLQSSIKFVKQ